MAIDLSNDRIYVTWTDFSLGYYTARIMFAHSTDGGSSFILYNGDGVLVQPTGTYLPAYPDTVRSTPALGVVPNPIVEVGSTGEVYVMYLIQYYTFILPHPWMKASPFKSRSRFLTQP